MSDGVTPTLPAVVEVGEVVEDELVDDVHQHQLLLGAAEDSLLNKSGSNVGNPRVEKNL